MVHFNKNKFKFWYNVFFIIRIMVYINGNDYYDVWQCLTRMNHILWRKANI